MMDWPLHFLRPWWWLALAPLPAVLWWLARHDTGRAAFARLVDASLLPHVVRGGPARHRVALGWLALAWLLATVALAGPAWQKVATPLYVNGSARVVALSLADDMLATDLKPDRMAHARFAVHDLLESAGDARTALVAFAGAAFTVAPLTDDKRTVLNLLRALQPNVMPVPGNAAAAGIRRSVELLQQAHVRGGEIVLVTDTAGAAAVTAARAARALGIRVDVLGVGTTAGAPVPQASGGFATGTGGVLMARRDDAALRAVAAAGGGNYAVLQPDGGGAANFTVPIAAGQMSHDQRADLWRDGGVWLLPVLVMVAAFGFRRGWLWVLALCVLPLATPRAQAGTLGAWFGNRDQRALQALQRGDPALAQKLATTPAMRGAADYRAGHFADAAKAFAQGRDARARYNLGNALAKQGQYPQAIAAYQQALHQQPGMADARANLAAVKAWLKRHPHRPHSARRGQAQPNAQPKSSSAGPGSGQGDHGDSAGQSLPAAPATTGKQTASAKGASGNHAAASPSPSGGGKSVAPAANAAPTASSAAAQQAQAQAAISGLAHELAKARSQAGRPFALGQAKPHNDGKFNAEQRAMLNAVPDDPGALLRRKFKLEWEQRQGQSQTGGQP